MGRARESMGRIKSSVSNRASSRASRAADYRFGDMGMGVPQNAPRGSQNIPMLESGYSRRAALRHRLSPRSLPIDMEGFGSTLHGDQAKAFDARTGRGTPRVTRRVPSLEDLHARDAAAFDRRTGRGTPRVSRPVPISAAPPTAAPTRPVAPASSAGAGPLADVSGQAPNPGPGRASRLQGLMKGKNFKRNALIGAGVVAAASVVQSRRSGGTSRGRQSNYRY